MQLTEVTTKECEEVREAEHTLVSNKIFKSIGCSNKSQWRDLRGGIMMIQTGIKIRLQTDTKHYRNNVDKLR